MLRGSRWALAMAVLLAIAPNESQAQFGNGYYYPGGYGGYGWGGRAGAAPGGGKGAGGGGAGGGPPGGGAIARAAGFITGGARASKTRTPPSPTPSTQMRSCAEII